jgi:hypothetical protein
MMKTLRRMVGLLIVTMCFVFILQARAETNSGYTIYLPLIAKPPFTVADFNNCNKINNLGGEMGAAFEPSTFDWLIETYVPEAGRGCVAKLDYGAPTLWAAFWLKLVNADLTEQTVLSFDVKFIDDNNSGSDNEIKVELKRGCHDDTCDEVWIQYVSVIADVWETKEINLADFYSLPGMVPPPLLTNIEELVFTFENGRISSKGVIFLDNIVFEP